MRLLRTLTIGYAVVLVLALASSLTAIWVYLRRIASGLGDVRSALASVSADTAPLGQHIEPLHGKTAESAEALAAARASLERADERLGMLTERHVPTEVTR